MRNFRPQATVVRLALLALIVAAAALAAASSWGAHQTGATVGMTPDTMRTPNIAQRISQAADPTGDVQFGCQKTHPAGCYGPDQLRRAYGLGPLQRASGAGAGRTIVIIDAYGSPTLDTDVAAFDSVWGLPAADYEVVAPFGVDPTDPDNAAGWAGEVSLDVEWAHAIAPGASIELVVAKSNDDADILDATEYAIDNNLGDVISQSFGEGEACMTTANLARQHALFQQAVAEGMTLFASSGDQGAGQPNCDGSPGYFKSASTPASDPNVTAVGGTDLIANGVSGKYVSESTWNESALFDDAVAGGGGVSTLFARPAYQALAAPQATMREVPDVSYNAAVYHGVIVAFDGAFYRFGGTSAGSPQWAAIGAMADQAASHRLGNINPALYLLGSNPITGRVFHDIADGSSNTVPDGNGGTIEGYTATPGYDMATGLGTPNIAAMIPTLAKLHH